MPRNSKCSGLIGKLEKKLSVMMENDMLPSEQALAEEFGVSKPTLRRALQAMADSGQVKKINGVGVMVARPPRSISRELIFLCHDIVFFAEALKSFGIKAAESNYFMSIVPLAGDEETQNRIVLSVLERNPAGVTVFSDPRHNDLTAFHQLAASRIPAVYLMRLPYGIDNNLLEFGNAEGVAEIVERFYNEGCRRFALYGDPTANPAASQERIKGFFAGMKKCRLKVRKDLVCPPVADEKKFLAFLDVFEDPARRPDAVCCINDYSAGLLIKEFEKRKIDISGIQFSGFDYSPLVRFIPKSILTVKAPVAELGKTAAETLIRQVENPHFGFRKSKLKVKVVKTLQ